MTRRGSVSSAPRNMTPIIARLVATAMPPPASAESAHCPPYAARKNPAIASVATACHSAICNAARLALGTSTLATLVGSDRQQKSHCAERFTRPASGGYSGGEEYSPFAKAAHYRGLFKVLQRSTGN